MSQMAFNSALRVDMSQPSSYEELAVMFLKKKPVKGKVQPPTSPPEDKLHRNTNALQFMKKVIATVYKHPDSWPFRKPVDAEDFNLPDYHSIINYSMDLATIRRRLSNFYYYDVNECIRDFRLIIYNCYLYNKVGSKVYSVGKNMENLFVQEMAYCPQKEIEIPIPPKPSKSKRKTTENKKIESTKAEVCNPGIVTSSATVLAEKNLKSTQCFPCTSVSFTSTSQAGNVSIILTCPECGYHSGEMQDFIGKRIQGVKTSNKLTRQQSSQSTKKQRCAYSSSGSSDSDSSENSVKVEIQHLQEALKKLSEKMDNLKEFNGSKKKGAHKPTSKVAKKVEKRKANSMHKKKKQPTCAVPARLPCIPPAKCRGNPGMQNKDSYPKSMSFDEKVELGNKLQKLKGEEIDAVKTIVQLMEPSYCDFSSSDQIVIDVCTLKTPTLQKLQNYMEQLKKAEYNRFNTEEVEHAFNRSNSEIVEDSSNSATTTSSSSGSFLFCSNSTSSSDGTSRNDEKQSTAEERSMSIIPNPSPTAARVMVERNHPPLFPISSSGKNFYKSTSHVEDHSFTSSGMHRNFSQLIFYTSGSTTGMINSHDAERQFPSSMVQQIQQVEKKVQNDSGNKVSHP